MCVAVGTESPVHSHGRYLVNYSVSLKRKKEEGIHRNLFSSFFFFFFFWWGGGGWRGRCCLELYSWGVEVLTAID